MTKWIASYLHLVKEFPLTEISDDKHLATAQRVLDRLLETRLDDGGQAYLDVLTDLIESYEDEHESIPDASESDVLRELMSSHQLSQTTLSKGVGISQSTISAVLSGTRSLTKDQIVILAEYFHVSPAVFLPV